MVAKSAERAKEITLQGVGVSPGIAIGKAFFPSVAKPKLATTQIDRTQVEAEILRYRHALARCLEELVCCREQWARDGISEGVALADAHMMLVKDRGWKHEVEERIRNLYKTSEAALTATVAEYKKRFSQMKDPCFQERFSDIRAIGQRLFYHLGGCYHEILHGNKNVILFADEISPSDTLRAKKVGIVAFVCLKGGQTCHAAILAKAQGFPYVMGIDRKEVQMASNVIIDGKEGLVVINPCKERLQYFRNKQHKLQLAEKQKKVASIACTRDGIRIAVHVNIEQGSSLKELRDVDGVGLFRSESMVISSKTIPSEEEQYAVYRAILEAMPNRPVVIRIFDLGGDKTLPWMLGEDNPFLGCRAIRLLLKEQALFTAQLRALLRASLFGQLRILFPMVATVEDIVQVKELLKTVEEELRAANIAFNPRTPLGCMIEVPSAVLTIDQLMPHVDFFSIGTNDLIQYTLAVDRGNPSVSHLYDPLHPAILRLIEMTVKSCQKYRKPVAVCGEMAADPQALPLLLGLGIRELSVSIRAIASVKETIATVHLKEAARLARKALRNRVADRKS